MFEKLSYDEFHELSLTHDRVAVYQEFSADLLTPMRTLHALETILFSQLIASVGLKHRRANRPLYRSH